VNTIDFSLCCGGPFYRAARTLGLARGKNGLLRTGVVLALLTWVPPALLALLHEAMEQGPISFFYSFGTHVRFLVAIPLFFFAEWLFDPRAGEAIRRLVGTEVIRSADHTRFAAAVAQAIRWRDSWLFEAALAALTVVLLANGLRTDLPADVLTWRSRADDSFTLAGWYYALVSIPIFQFLAWRWFGRLVIWSVLLWRVARLDLHLIATHPDGAGGLGVLGVPHVDLAPLALASTAVLSASYAEQVMFAGVPLSSLAVPVTGVVLGVTLMLIAPLLFFIHPLLETKQRALLEYGTLAATYTREFEAKWLRAAPPQDHAILGTADIQSLADLGTSFGLVRDMTILPISKAQILWIAASAALPFVPLLLIEFPLDQLIIDSFRTVFTV